MRPTLAVFVIALSGCHDGASDPREIAAREFGFSVSRAESTHGPVRWVDDCAWHPGLIVPAVGFVQIPIERGTHTLNGRVAVCDALAPVRFQIAIVAPGENRALLEIGIDAAQLRARSSEPFAVTFWADAPGAIELRTLESPPTSSPGFLDLELDSRPSTSSESSPEKPAPLPAPAVDLTPGRRARAPQLVANARGNYALADWGWVASSTSWGPLEIDRANGAEGPNDGPPLTMAKQVYAHGIGMHAPSILLIDLEQRCDRFFAEVGVDADAGIKGSVVFRVFGDGERLHETGVKRAGEAADLIALDVHGKKWLLIATDNTKDGPESDWADFGEPELRCQPAP